MPLGPGMATVTLDQSVLLHSTEPDAPAAGAGGMPAEPAPPLTRGMLARDASQTRRDDHDRNENTVDDALNAENSDSERSDDAEDDVSVATEASDTSVFTARSQLQRSGIEHSIVIPSPAVIPDNPTIKDLLSIIVSNRAETSTTLSNISTRLHDFEGSLEMAHSRASKNEGDIKALSKENQDLKKTVHTLTSQLREVQNDVCVVRDRQEATERRSREWGVRIHGVPETAREDTRLVLFRLIAKHKLAGLDTIERASQAIEHCHRLGPKTSGKHRAIIANIFSRLLRNLLIKEARPINNNTTTPIYIAEDMTKRDHELKLLARAQMREAYANGHKVSFRKGKLFIDAKEVPIEST